MDHHGITLSDLGRRYDETEEVIILKAGTHNDAPGRSKPLVEYADTPQVLQYRAELHRINRWLEAADIDVDDAGLSKPVDPAQRHLRRVFSNSNFSHCGRLFGGFWQEMKKVERKEAITINGEPVTILDYGQIAARILYGMAGVAPEGDLYDIGVPGADIRAGVKKVFNAMLYATKPLMRFPQHCLHHFPRGTRFEDIMAGITERHSTIAHHFFTGIGIHAMYLESEIMIDVLRTLIDHGIVALPIHDAVVVPASATELVRTVMLDVFHHHVGTQGVVTVED